jgi:lysozyme family protein
MAADSFERAFALTLKHEGGYVDHPRDPGGATNLGVTIGTLSNYLGRPASKAEVRALTPAAVKPIYRQRYWNAVRGDELPAGVDYATYDFAVNSGPKRAVIALQRVLEVADDGKVGPVTLAKLAKANPLTLCTKLCAERLAFLRRLSTWPTFGKGWARRVAGVEAEAVRMARDAAARPRPPEIRGAAPSPPLPASPPAVSGGFFVGLIAALIKRLRSH